MHLRISLLQEAAQLLSKLYFLLCLLVCFLFICLCVSSRTFLHLRTHTRTRFHKPAKTHTSSTRS
jgi:hypothetical protein